MHSFFFFFDSVYQQVSIGWMVVVLSFGLLFINRSIVKSQVFFLDIKIANSNETKQNKIDESLVLILLLFICLFVVFVKINIKKNANYAQNCQPVVTCKQQQQQQQQTDGGI